MKNEFIWEYVDCGSDGIFKVLFVAITLYAVKLFRKTLIMWWGNSYGKILYIKRNVEISQTFFTWTIQFIHSSLKKKFFSSKWEEENFLRKKEVKKF